MAATPTATAGSGTTNDPDPFQSMLESILPLKEIATYGREYAKKSGTDKPLQEDLKALEEYARAIARDTYTEKYDPAQNPQDKLRGDQHQTDLADLDTAKAAADYAAADLAEREDELAKKQSGRQRPQLSTMIFVAAVIALSLSISPTMHDRFFFTMEDDVLAWFVSLASASAIGVLITWSLLGSVAATGSRTAENVLGLIGGIGIGVGAGLLRISDAQDWEEYIFAAALTVMEISIVCFLEWLASGLRKEHSEWAAGQEEVNVLTARAKAAGDAYSRRSERVRELEKKILDHARYVEIRQVRHSKVKELEEAAVTTVLAAYHEGIASNRGRKLGLRLAS